MNKHIARLIIGAMSIDGSLNKEEQKKVAKTLEKLGMSELIPDVGAVIEEDFSDFNMFEECKALMEALGKDAEEFAPLAYRIIAEVIAMDRFVSREEASYLSAMARRLRLSTEDAKTIFKQVLANCRGRLEVAGTSIDEDIHPHLKSLLSFQGAEDLVGEIRANSFEELLSDAQQTLSEGCDYTVDDVDRSLAVLGLNSNATVEEAEEIWKNTLSSINLGKLSSHGETFVSAAIQKINSIHNAYKTILVFHEHLNSKEKAKSESRRLSGAIARASEPSTRNNYDSIIRENLTGIGTGVEPIKDI